MTAITQASILIISTNGFEQSELEVPRDKLREHGATVHVASPDGRTIKGWDGNDWGQDAPVDLQLSDAKMEDYDALVLPGGQMNPDILRADRDAVALIRSFVDAGKTVAAICHAPWLLIEAGVVEGREMTSYTSIRTDLRNAGATVVDKPVAVAGNIVTSRDPDDLNDFVGKIVELIEAGGRESDAA